MSKSSQHLTKWSWRWKGTPILYENVRSNRIKSLWSKNLETKLPAGNAVIYSKKSKGATTGTVGFYATDEDTEAKIFGYKKNTAGNILYGMKDQKPYMALIAEFTAVNPATGVEEDGYLIFPKVALGEISNDISTKDADGNETFNAKSLAFTAMALDNENKTYKLKGFGTTPSTITTAMFDPTSSS